MKGGDRQKIIVRIIHLNHYMGTNLTQGGNNQMSSLTNKFFLFLIVGTLCMAPGVSWGESDKPTADLSVSFMSQYIWRGYELSRDSLVIQPSVTIGYKGFSANIWQNIDTDYWDYKNNPDMDSLNETDTTLAYSMDMEQMSAEVGYIWYALDQEDDSQEVYVSASLKTLLSPTLTIYREFAHYPSTYITLGVSHSIALPRDMSLDLSLQGSYLISNDKEAYPDPDDPKDDYNNFHDGLLSVALSIPATEYVTITPEIDWSFPLCDDAADAMQAGNAGHGGKDNFLYGGVTVSLSF